MKARKYTLLSIIAMITAIGVSVPIESNDVTAGRNALFSLAKYCKILLESMTENRLFSVGAFIFTIILILIYVKMEHKEKANMIASALFSGLFVLMQMICNDLRADNNIDEMVGSGYNIFKGLVIFCSYFILVYLISFIGGYSLFDKCADRVSSSISVNKKIGNIKEWLVLSAKTVVFWIPYYILFFPGTSNYGDTEKQIRMFFHRKVVFPLNVSPVQGPDIFITDHHPFFTTWLYGSFVKIGLFFGKAWIGVALFSLCQMIIVAAVLNWIWFRISNQKVSEKFVKYGIWFTRLFPFYPILSVCMVKDMTFSIFCLTTVLLLFELRISGEEILGKKQYALLMMLSVLFMIMSKGQGKYFAIALLLILIVAYKKYWKTILFSFAVPILFYQLIWSNILLPAWNIAPGGSQESIGFMLQQTARYVVEYKEEVTEDEARVISKVIDYDNIEELFDPCSTNPIKITYNQELDKADKRKYYLCWASMFLKHPGVYVESVLNTSYKYFDITWVGNPFFAKFNSRVDSSDEIYIESFFTKGSLGNYIVGLFKLIQKIPVLGLVFAPSFYTWLAVFLFLATLREKNVGVVIVEIIPILTVLIFFICPRSLPRYSMPLILMASVMMMNLLFRNGVGVMSNSDT